MKEYKFKINGNNYNVAIGNVENGIADVSVNGTGYKVELEEGMVPKTVNQTNSAPSAARQSAPQASPAPQASSGNAAPLKSPLPGVILEVNVREGDSVKQGQSVMVLEAMKMENNIDANKTGVVKSINKRQGDSVLEGDILLTIE